MKSESSSMDMFTAPREESVDSSLHTPTPMVTATPTANAATTSTPAFSTTTPTFQPHSAKSKSADDDVDFFRKFKDKYISGDGSHLTLVSSVPRSVQRSVPRLSQQQSRPLTSPPTSSGFRLPGGASSVATPSFAQMREKNNEKVLVDGGGEPNFLSLPSGPAEKNELTELIRNPQDHRSQQRGTFGAGGMTHADKANQYIAMVGLGLSVERGIYENSHNTPHRSVPRDGIESGGIGRDLDEELKTFQPDPRHRERLLKLYQETTPHKIKNINRILYAFQGKEEKLFRQLEQQRHQRQQVTAPASSVPRQMPEATAGAATAAEQERLTAYNHNRQRLVDLYTEHAPERVGDVDKMMAVMPGREAEMIDALEFKYLTKKKENGSRKNSSTLPSVQQNNSNNRGMTAVAQPQQQQQTAAHQQSTTYYNQQHPTATPPSQPASPVPITNRSSRNEWIQQKQKELLKQQYVDQVNEMYTVFNPELAYSGSAEHVVASWPDGQEETSFQSLRDLSRSNTSTNPLSLHFKEQQHQQQHSKQQAPPSPARDHQQHQYHNHSSVPPQKSTWRVKDPREQTRLDEIHL